MPTHKRTTIESVLSQVETTGEIAARTGYSGPAVANWPKRFSADHSNPFPAAVGRKGNATLYVSSEVDAWLATFEQTTINEAAEDMETVPA